MDNVMNKMNFDPTFLRAAAEAAAQAAEGATGADGVVSVDVVTAGAEALSVSNKTAETDLDKAKKASELEIPVIDAPDFKIVVKIDITRLTAILNIESDAEQAEVMRTVIDSQKGTISAESKKRLDKINDTLKKMDDAAKASIFQKIFGWVMVAVAALMAVALSVASGGVAIGAVVGAALALTFQVMNETKVTELILKKLAESIQNTFGCDKATAQMWATIVWTSCQLAASIAGGWGADKIASAVGGANKVLKTMNMAMQALREFSTKADKALKLVGLGSILMGVGSTAASTYTNYASGMSQAELQKFSAMLLRLQKMMEDNEEILNELMKLLAAGPDQLLKLLSGVIEVDKQIAENIGNPAC